jgi:hypothetical protein
MDLIYHIDNSIKNIKIPKEDFTINNEGDVIKDMASANLLYQIDTELEIEL